MGEIAITGIRADMSGMTPSHESTITTIPVAAEYPMRPPIAFQPGCPM